MRIWSVDVQYQLWQHVSVFVPMGMRSGVMVDLPALTHMGVCAYPLPALQKQSLCIYSPCLHDSCLCPCMRVCTGCLGARGAGGALQGGLGEASGEGSDAGICQ